MPRRPWGPFANLTHVGPVVGRPDLREEPHRVVQEAVDQLGLQRGVAPGDHDERASGRNVSEPPRPFAPVGRGASVGLFPGPHFASTSASRSSVTGLDR